jgi:hypothetical protein
MWCPYIIKKINYIQIILVITFLGGLVCFHPTCPTIKYIFWKKSNLYFQHKYKPNASTQL